MGHTPLSHFSTCFITLATRHFSSRFVTRATNMQRSTIMVTVVAMIAVVGLLGGADARHLLDTQSGPTIVDVMRCDGTFGILKAAAAKAGLVDALTGPDADITVFAPTNKAFGAALEQLGLTKDELLESDSLADILKYHVISGKVKSDDLQEGETVVDSLLGPNIIVKNEGDGISVNDASVEYADLEACNGVVHVIDKVLLPPAEMMVKMAEEGSPQEDGTAVLG